MQLRRMADASLALAERRPDDLKQAVERLGQAPPSNRQLFLLRLMGFLAPPASAPWYMKARGFLIILLLVIVLLAVGFGLAKLITLPFGGAGTAGQPAARHRGHRRDPGRAGLVRTAPAGAGQREGARRAGRLTCAGATRSRRLTRRACASASRIGDTVPVRPRYNVAPGDDVLAVTTDREGEPRGELLRWGLVPYWAKDPKTLGPQAHQRALGDDAHQRRLSRRAPLPRRGRRLLRVGEAPRASPSSRGG